MRTSPIRFSGMASGMDTDSIVKNLMAPQQYKIDQEKKAQALVKLKQDAWKDMNRKLNDFHTKFTSQMRLESTFNKSNITSSNPNAISIEDGATATQGTHQFEVVKLAESAKMTGTLKQTGVETTTRIGALDGLKSLEGSEDPLVLSMRVGDKDILVKLDLTDQVGDIGKKMNAALKDYGFTANFDEKNGKFFVNSNKTGAEVKLEIGFMPKVLEIKNDKGDMVPISEQSVRNGRTLFKELGLIEDTKFTATMKGKDAEYKYNGETFFSSTNKVEVNGIQATLKAVTTGPVTIESTHDTDAIYTWVKDFVTEYNSLIDDINGKLGAKPGKNIKPLTAEERESMSDSEIKLWEEKLNGSLFYKDEDLTKFADSARGILGMVLGGVADGDHNSLASLGIVSGSWEEKGKLHILGDPDDPLYKDRPDKLREAINKDPNKVIDFLSKMGRELYSAHDKVFKTSNKLKSGMGFYNDKAMNDKFKGFEDNISKLEARMYRMEDMQYAKFAAMEKMLSSLNNQSSWLAQQFGGN